jgi:hypothetical protein
MLDGPETIVTRVYAILRGDERAVEKRLNDSVEATVSGAYRPKSGKSACAAI